MFLFKWFSSLFSSDFFKKEKNQLFTILFIIFLILLSNFVLVDFFTDKPYDTNFFYLNFLKFNFFFLFDVYKNNFLLLIDLLFYSFNLVFFNNSYNNFNFDKIIYSLNFNEYSNNILYFFNFDKIIYSLNFNEYSNNILYFNNSNFNSNYYNLILYKFYLFFFSFNENLHNIIIYSYNLPIFFYFGVFFILTTLFSLILLSYLGLYGVFIINLFSLILFWLSTCIYLNIFFLDNIFIKINLGKWFVVNTNYPIFFELFIDSISFSFMFLTLTIATFVYIYAFSYFRYEPNVERLLLLINCFVISMVCLVTSGNFFVLFLGWELIGLTSFFLINFWSTRMSTLKSAFKAFTFNKFSDVSLLISILIIYYVLGDISIGNFNYNISYYNNFYINILNYDIPLIEITSFFLIGCAFVKSAQFGFHIWLPDSMEAPVPASALIHSATLVSAGVFILLRLSFLFEYSLYSYYIIPLVGSFTAFFGGLCSAYQSDIKKILAYSTISHCGFLMVCYSTYITEYTILYLYIHGFFKASVFLCVGNIIRFSRNYQDFRRMGNFWKYLPFECFMTFVCLINLCGLPFSIGFYIKHLLVLGFNINTSILYFIHINILFGAISGLFYSYRLFYNVFFDFKKSKKILYNQSNRLLLNSFNYSNTSLASNIAIFMLIFFSYVISLYLFNIFLNSSSLGEGLNIYSVNSSQYEEFNNPLLSSINNIGYFNWFLLLIILLIITLSWRLGFNYYLIYNNYTSFLLFFIFFYFFYNCL